MSRGPPCSHGPRMVHRVNRNVVGNRTGESKLLYAFPAHSQIAESMAVASKAVGFRDK
jgi:hypothetical protein